MSWHKGIAISMGVLVVSAMAAKGQESSSGASVVPRLVNFSGVVKDSTGKPVAGSASLTFSLYELQDGGRPLWVETQTVQTDVQGHYTALLGANTPEGLPIDLFTSGSARWLGITPAIPGLGELPRVLLVGVPYALKAADADTLGGLPATAFVQTSHASGTTAFVPPSTVTTTKSAATSVSGTGGNPKLALPASISGSGKTNFIPIWTNSTTLSSSSLFQKAGQLGIGTQTPAATLDVNGTANFRQSVTFAGGQTFPGAATLGANNFTGNQTVSAGWLGIGTTTPGGPLDVQGGYSYLNGLRISGADKNATIWQPTGAGTLGIYAEDGTMFLQPYGGNVGIGTTNPTNKLQINGGPVFLSGNTDTVWNAATYYTQDTGANSRAFAVGARNGAFSISDETASAVRFYITSSGNVGIGATNPTAKLEVNGATKFDQPITFPDGTTQSTAASSTGGTITGVTAGTGLAGGGTSGNVTLSNSGVLGVGVGQGLTSTGGQIPTLSLNTAFTSSLYAQLAASNTFSGNQTVSGNVTISGTGNGVTFADGTKQTTGGGAFDYQTIAQVFSGPNPTEVNCPTSYIAVSASCDEGADVVINDKTSPLPAGQSVWVVWLTPTANTATGVHCGNLQSSAQSSTLLLRCSRLH